MKYPKQDNAKIHICFLKSSRNSLEEDVLDLISCHLRFADKYLLKRKWNDLTEKRICFPYFFHDFFPCTAGRNDKQRSLPVDFQSVECLDQRGLLLPVGDQALDLVYVCFQLRQVSGKKNAAFVPKCICR